MNTRLPVAALLASALLAVGAGAGAALAQENAISEAAVNARACGSTSCEVLYVLPPQTPIRVISIENGWCETERDGYPTAWVSCSYLSALSAPSRGSTSRDDDDDDDRGGYAGGSGY